MTRYTGRSVTETLGERASSLHRVQGNETWRQRNALHFIFRNRMIHVFKKNKLYYVIYRANRHLYLTKFLRKVIGKKVDKNVFFVNMYKAIVYRKINI
jgi:hypothetical protein